MLEISFEEKKINIGVGVCDWHRDFTHKSPETTKMFVAPLFVSWARDISHDYLFQFRQQAHVFKSEKCVRRKTLLLQSRCVELVMFSTVSKSIVVMSPAITTTDPSCG